MRERAPLWRPFFYAVVSGPEGVEAAVSGPAGKAPVICGCVICALAFEVL